MIFSTARDWALWTGCSVRPTSTAHMDGSANLTGAEKHFCQTLNWVRICELSRTRESLEINLTPAFTTLTTHCGEFLQQQHVTPSSIMEDVSSYVSWLAGCCNSVSLWSSRNVLWTTRLLLTLYHQEDERRGGLSVHLWVNCSFNHFIFCMFPEVLSSEDNKLIWWWLTRTHSVQRWGSSVTWRRSLHTDVHCRSAGWPARGTDPAWRGSPRRYGCCTEAGSRILRTHGEGQRSDPEPRGCGVKHTLG